MYVLNIVITLIGIELNKQLGWSLMKKTDCSPWQLHNCPSPKQRCPMRKRSGITDDVATLTQVSDENARFTQFGFKNKKKS